MGNCIAGAPVDAQRLHRVSMGQIVVVSDLCHICFASRTQKLVI